MESPELSGLLERLRIQCERGRIHPKYHTNAVAQVEKTTSEEGLYRLMESIKALLGDV